MRRTFSTGKLTKVDGFTYVMVLVAVVVVSIMAQVATILTSRIIVSDKESELLFRGQAYVSAISSYYYALPAQPTYPRFLSELESDSRFLHKRHIRQLYPDPFGNEWQLIRNGEGKIIGVASRSTQQPSKISNFPEGLEAFQDAEQYRQWQFLYLPNTKKNM